MKEAGYGKEDICTDLFVDIAALALFSDRDYCDLLIYKGGKTKRVNMWSV